MARLSGLGSGFAKLFSEKKARLLLAGRNEEKLRLVKDRINGDDGAAQTPLKKNSLLNKGAAVLVVMSFILYGLILAVPFLPLSIVQKAALVPILIASGEAAWWIGVAILGKQVVTKYRKYLNPCNWFSCLGNKELNENKDDELAKTDQGPIKKPTK